MKTEFDNTENEALNKTDVSSSASRFMENFFEDGEFYTDLEDFIYKVFDGEEEQVRELEEDAVFECKGSKLEPIIDFSTQWITERIDDDRFSENNVDSEIDEIEKVLNGNIDFEKINALIPKLYFVDRRNKLTITKQDLLDAL